MNEQALEYLIDKAQKSRNIAAVELAQSRTAEKEIIEQIQMLRNYRRDYRGQMQEAMFEAIPLQFVRDFHEFLKSLDHSIASAEAYLEKQQQNIRHSLEEMQKLQREVSSFGALIERRKQSQLQETTRRERKDHDALASQIYSRKQYAGHNFNPMTD